MENIKSFSGNSTITWFVSWSLCITSSVRKLHAFFYVHILKSLVYGITNAHEKCIKEEIFWNSPQKSKWASCSFCSLLISFFEGCHYDTFTVTKRNTKTSQKAIMPEWCRLLQHRPTKLNTMFPAGSCWKRLAFSFFSAHLYSIVSLSIRRETTCCTFDGLWVELRDEDLYRHNADLIIIFSSISGQRKQLKGMSFVKNSLSSSQPYWAAHPL